MTACVRTLIASAFLALASASCGGGGSSTPPAVNATPTPAATATPLPGLPLALNVNNLQGQFYGEIVAQFSGVSPRQLVMLPNGDLLVGTGGGTANFGQSGKIEIVPNAEAAVPGAPTVFATLADGACASSAGTNTNGITFAPANGGGTIFVGMECSVWKIPYVTGDRTASSAPVQFVRVRTGPVAPGSDGDVHHTTSVLYANGTLYVSVGSSCNACIETDPTRGVILERASQLRRSRPSPRAYATRWRSPSTRRPEPFGPAGPVRTASSARRASARWTRRTPSTVIPSSGSTR